MIIYFLLSLKCTYNKKKKQNKTCLPPQNQYLASILNWVRRPFYFLVLIIGATTLAMFSPQQETMWLQSHVAALCLRSFHRPNLCVASPSFCNALFIPAQLVCVPIGPQNKNLLRTLNIICS